MPDPASGGWTSLEIAKLLVAALTPLLILILTLVLNSRTKKLEQRWRDADRVHPDWKRNEKFEDAIPETGADASALPWAGSAATLVGCLCGR